MFHFRFLIYKTQRNYFFKQNLIIFIELKRTQISKIKQPKQINKMGNSNSKQIQLTTRGIFQIKITKEYEIKCSLFNKKTIEEIMIETNDNILNIDNQQQIMKEWVENPNEYRLYQIVYQEKEYSLLPEVIFALIINECKEKIEKEYVIENTTIRVESTNNIIKERVNISLNTIGIKGIKVKEIVRKETIDYVEQGELLQEIIEKKKI